MSLPAAVPTISEEEFQKFRDFFYRKTGIYFEDNKRYFVDKRLIDRILATDNTTFRGYFVMLRFETSGKELQQLTNLITVNETYFFREEYQFTCLVNSILADILPRKRRGESIRIWSVPSSSGEEPYSLAIYLLEYWPQVNQYDIELIAFRYRHRDSQQGASGSLRSTFDLAPVDPLAAQVLYGSTERNLSDQR